MGLRVPEVTTCCCYFSLRTGAKVFGFISLVGCFLLAVLSACQLIGVGHEENYMRIVVEVSIDIVVQATQMVTAVLLLLGIYWEKPNYIPPWLVTTVINVILEIVFLPSLPGRFIGISNQFDLILFLIVCAIMLLDDIYGWLVVFNYYRALSPHSGNVV